MKVKTQTLSSRALNYVMAKASGHQWRYPWMLEKDGATVWLSAEEAWGNIHPDYVSGERVLHLIETEISGVYKRDAQEPDLAFKAEMINDNKFYWAFGPTAAVAVLRCYLLAKLGPEVELPKELT